MLLREERRRHVHVGSRAVAPLPRSLDLGGQFDKILVETEGQAAADLVALLFARQTRDGIVEGCCGGYNEAGVARQAGWGKDMGLDARVGGLCGGRGGTVEDQDGRVGEQLIGGVEEREVGCGDGRGLLVDYDTHGYCTSGAEGAGTSDGGGMLGGGQMKMQPQWHRAAEAT